MQRILRLFILGTALCALSGSVSAAEKSTATRVVQKGMLVSLQYTLTGEDGKLIESNKGKEPLKYVHGKPNEMIPGLERELTGMKVGAEKHVIVKPEDAYGLVDYNKMKEVSKDQIPPVGMKVGAELGVNDEQGHVRMFKVHEVRENSVVLDMNHPMAGKTLVFDVKILDIQPVATITPASPAKPAAPAPPDRPAQPR
jgi:FKBP-type peptidyl-prolyl cis-trans isomerase SlyD